MIDFELAKELKAAGFPQPADEGASGRAYTPDGELTSYDNCCGFLREASDGEVIYLPTLDQLIRMCGDNFVRLMKKGSVWSVWGYNVENDFTGGSPEEAVARLWLALNRK